MAHIKAETLSLVCCNVLRYPLTVKCDSQDESNIYCNRKFGDWWEVNEHCEHSKYMPQFIERNYKSFEAYEHESSYDYLDGCWDLSVSRAIYVCSYLEIDGHVYCDVRGEYTGFDPRIKYNGENEDEE